MAVQFNHTIIHASDNARSARFLADMLGLPEPARLFHFMAVELDNGVSLDFLTTDQTISSRHFAFLVDDATFDRGLARIRELGLPYWADPAREQAGEINNNDGGRGVYFPDPDDHLLEMITTPYGVQKA